MTTTTRRPALTMVWVPMIDSRGRRRMVARWQAERPVAAAVKPQSHAA